MMNKARKASRKRLSKGFADETGGVNGQHPNTPADVSADTSGHDPDTPGQTPDIAEHLPGWIAQVQVILSTKNRCHGEYSAVAIAEACQVNDSTIRNRWLKSINSEIADERCLKASNGKYTQLAMELFAHMATCRDAGLNPAEWVLQVLRPALATTSPTDAREPDEYQTALARRENENDTRSKTMAIQWAEMKQRRQQEAQTQQHLSQADLERIRLEEKAKLLTEVEERDRIRRELLAELGLL